MAKQKPVDDSWLDAYGIKSPKKRAFLVAFSLLGTVTHASKACGVSRKSHYLWMKDDDAERYNEALDEARERACDVLEAEARRRAVNGVDKAVFHQGEKVGTVKEYSDTLLIFLLKGAMPDKYKDRVDHRHSGAKLEDLLEDGDKPK